MPRLADDQTVRELIRKNVGRLAPPVVHLMGPLVSGRFGLTFANGNLEAGTPPGVPVDQLPPPPTQPTLPQGRIIGIALSVAAASREVGVTTTLPAPCVIRAITISGSCLSSEALSFRILLASDSDTSAVANPTGTDLIEFAGDVIGAEDPGCHAELSSGALTVEPWRQVLTAGQRVKLKVHNLSASTRSIAVYLDIDALV